MVGIQAQGTYTDLQTRAQRLTKGSFLEAVNGRLQKGQNIKIEIREGVLDGLSVPMDAGNGTPPCGLLHDDQQSVSYNLGCLLVVGRSLKRKMSTRTVTPCLPHHICI